MLISNASFKYNSHPTAPSNRRGAAAILGIVMLVTLTIALSMSVDLGHIHRSQTELQRASDAAALAGCWELFDAKVSGIDATTTAANVRAASDTLASVNRIASESAHLATNDLELGVYDFSSNSFTNSTPAGANAVRIILNRNLTTNGEVRLYFGGILGRHSQSLKTTSTAALIKNIHGFSTPPTAAQTLDILPFALDEETWLSVLAGQTNDSFTFNGSVTSGSNGYYECNLYPQGTGSPGNRGTVDIGSANNSTNDIARQIVNGISRDDLIALGRPLELDASGELLLNGDTGISAGVKDELTSIIGQNRVIPIYRSVSGNGNNAMYRIVRFAGVRILDVKLTGKMSDKRVIVEPALVIARNATLSTDARYTSDFVVSPAMLVD